MIAAEISVLPVPVAISKGSVCFPDALFEGRAPRPVGISQDLQPDHLRIDYVEFDYPAGVTFEVMPLGKGNIILPNCSRASDLGLGLKRLRCWTDPNEETR